MIKTFLQKVFRNKFLIGIIFLSIITGLVYSYLNFRKHPTRIPLITKTAPTPTATLPFPTQYPTGQQSPGEKLFGPATKINELQALPNTAKTASQEEKAKILSIYIKDFNTSSGIKTTINIFSIKGDDPSFIRVEIYGINYYNSSPDKENPDYVAFVESLIKAKEEIHKLGANPDELIYIFYTRENIHLTAENWAKKAGLINY
jgi:hypothetical protein